MKIIQMRYFQTVCRYNNISKAAIACEVSQPAISCAIKDLEEEFGVRLFVRNNNRLSLTEDGRFFLSQVNYLLSKIEETEVQMKDRGERLKTIRIGVPPIIGTFIFPRLVNGFLKIDPEVQFSITETGSLKVMHLLENGTVDLGIVTYDSEMDKKFAYIELVDTEFVFAVDKKHHFAKRETIRFEDLDRESIILYAIGSYQARLITQKIEQTGIHPHVFLHSSQLASILECLKISNTGAFLHKELVAMNPEIIGIPFEDPIRVKIGIVYNRVSGLLSSPKKFVDYAESVYCKSLIE